jgi:hypothetical protein
MPRAANGDQDFINHYYPVLRKNFIDASTYADPYRRRNIG